MSLSACEITDSNASGCKHDDVSDDDGNSCATLSFILKASGGDAAHDDYADTCTHSIPFHIAPAAPTSALRAQQRGSDPQTAKHLIQGV